MDWSLEFMNDVYELIEKPYSQRTYLHFWAKRIHAAKCSIGIPSCLSPKLWELFSNEYKAIASLVDFKAKINACVAEYCPCKVMQNIYSPVLVSFPHDNFRIMIRLSIYKKIIFALLCRYMTFSLFLTLISFFCIKLCKTFSINSKK